MGGELLHVEMLLLEKLQEECMHPGLLLLRADEAECVIISFDRAVDAHYAAAACEKDRQ